MDESEFFKLLVLITSIKSNKDRWWRFVSWYVKKKNVPQMILHHIHILLQHIIYCTQIKDVNFQKKKLHN